MDKIVNRLGLGFAEGGPTGDPGFSSNYSCSSTRPVKIIRLVGRNTVEEIILKRADDKLKLTNTVIEGGQVSTVTLEK